MIIVDGGQSNLKIEEFENVEQILQAIMEDKAMEGRIVTDVLINNEPFSEIYPHQSEDMECSGITSIEVRTREAASMAVDMSGELEKVARMMGAGSRSIARLLRDNQNTDALEMFQDLLDVTRDFMGMLGHLREKYLGGADADFVAKTEKFSDLINELSEVLENEDWILLADLLEYEFAPACDSWREVGKILHKQLEQAYKK